MAYEQREGDISLFPNDKKTSQNQPDYRGTALINGEKLKISLWVKSGQRGQFFSGKIEPDNYVPREVAPKQYEPELPEPDPIEPESVELDLPF